MAPAREPLRDAQVLDAQLLDALDAALLSLLQRAPLGTPAELAQAAELALALALDAAGAAVRAAEGAAAAQAAHVAAKLSAERTGLACAMERCLELIGEGLVDPGVALPALAMAAHSARATYLPAVAAARYEIETLLPIPGKATAIKKRLDVPAASLVRRPLRASGEVGSGTAAGAGEAGASREGLALQGPSAPATAGGPVGAWAAVAPHRLEALWSAHPAAAVSLVQAARQRLRA